MKITCWTCRDEGTIEGCKKCGKKKGAISIDRLKHSRYELKIPKYYREKNWEKTEDTLTSKILSSIKNNPVIDRSIIICSEEEDLVLWAYNTLHLAYQKGLTVFPLLSGIQLNNFYKSYATYGHQDKYSKLLGFDYIDVMESDVMIIDVEEKYRNYYTQHAIHQTIVERSKNDRATIVISSVPWEVMKGASPDGELASLEKEGKVNRLRYPVIVDERRR